MDDRGAVGAVLDLAGLGLLDGLGDVHRDGADLRVGHLALRAEDAAEAADDGHHVGRRDGDVEVGEAVLDALGEVVGADDVGAGLLGLARLVALGEDGDRDAPCPGRCGSAIVPRSCSSAWRTLRPVRTWTSTDSSNFARLSSLTSLTASAGCVLVLAVDLARASM